MRIGTSGWVYGPWHGVFYPKDMRRMGELTYLSRRLRSVELNGSFYALQKQASFQQWYAETPPGFVFSVKGGRFITHMKLLRDVGTPLANFFASGILALGPKLGPILWQLPPRLAFDADRLTAFFDLLPRSTAAAAELAARHDERTEGRAWTTTDADRPLRHALEVRHPSYRSTEFVELLRANGIGLVVADAAADWPRIEDVTADFVYLRLHGAEELYASGYSDAALDDWARRIRIWRDGKNVHGEHTIAAAAPYRRSGRDVFVYFDNDVKVRAPADAMALADRLGVGPDTVDEPADAVTRPG